MNNTNKSLVNIQDSEKRRNNSTLSYVDCCMRLNDLSWAFESMSDDDLDSLYAVAFGRWAYHLTRDGYIKSLYEYRKNKTELYER